MKTTETNIQEQVKNLPLPELSLQKPIPQDRFKEIELTEDEKEFALAEAREKKYYQKNNKEYWDKVSNPEYVKFNSVEEYKSAMIDIIKEKVNGFVFDEENKNVIKLLCLYFFGDKSFEKMGEGYSLSKGIYLYGHIGTGKTTLMKLFQQNPRSSYNFIECSKIATAYAISKKDQGGIDAIGRYFTLPQSADMTVFGNERKGYCFDDLGTENISKHFGNEMNVMQEILTERYKIAIGQTHVTTNLSAEDIEEYYGDRVKSRCREMFNIINFDGTTDRRR